MTYINSKARSLIELVVVLIAIFIIVGSLIGRGNILVLKTRESALTNELNSVRLAISLYFYLNKKYPDNLEMLINKNYTIGGAGKTLLKGTFLRPLKFDYKGRLKDPFGNIYLYKSKTGVVKSQTEAYEDW